MDLLLLLTFTLMTTCLRVDRTVGAQTLFIRDISLSIEPSTDVRRSTNVTMRCQAGVSTSGQQPFSREYTIYKDSIAVYTKTTSSSEDFLYLLPEARVSNTGKYKCQINIEGKQMSSDAKKLTVTGLSKPVLYLNKSGVSEGEEVTARCSAPSETGSIIFYFYMDSKEILEERVKSNQAVVKLRFTMTGSHKIHCDYTVLITPDSFKSDSSNSIMVSVKEISITLVLEVFPQYKVYEGDRVDISCTIQSVLHSLQNFNLYLSQGAELLSSGNTKVNHSMTALTKHSGEFECRLVMGNVVKVTTMNISVTELFSVPTLIVSPPEVFQWDPMTITCKSESYASERITRDEVIYALEPRESPMTPTRIPGVYSGKTLLYDFNYTCIAQAKGIVKRSKTHTVHPKVSVSHPKISVVGRVILGQPFQILCQAERGSLPINYTLLKDYNMLNTTTVKLPHQRAIFTVTIQKAEEISKYMCEANNKHHKEGLLGKRLNATVIVPLSHATLTVTPVPEDVTEGQHLFLICSVKGTPPITFKWYRVGHAQPLFTSTSSGITLDYQVPVLTREHSGTYYCEAINPAMKVVRSQSVTVNIRLAMWKKGLIIASCLLVVAVVVLLCLLRFKAKRARVERVTVSVCSEQLPNAASEQEVIMTHNTPEVEYTEVVHPRPADPAKVPLRKGTDTVYSELQNSPQGAADHRNCQGSGEYAELNGEQPDISHHSQEVNNVQGPPPPPPPLPRL
ncbi:platelet endothelial cell adhesion molecule isoform X3 [Thalassophryne amazonica]|uniref:platelet endothelial cell adhesion molecule isoform X3 n=1 Tax=Thalassophryne amazonica TaxID=390379 RepID=UPI0014708D71|nr:platelet endothelial cell adhesion molecule isoform X3 [Thalassophryne amazonica]